MSSSSEKWLILSSFSFVSIKSLSVWRGKTRSSSLLPALTSSLPHAIASASFLDSWSVLREATRISSTIFYIISSSTSSSDESMFSNSQFSSSLLES